MEGTHTHVFRSLVGLRERFGVIKERIKAAKLRRNVRIKGKLRAGVMALPGAAAPFNLTSSDWETDEKRSSGTAQDPEANGVIPPWNKRPLLPSRIFP